MNPSPGPNPGPSTPRSDPSNPYPTTFIQADPSSFKQIVQSLTGSDTKNESQPSIKLYERRNTSLKHNLHIPTRVSHHPYLSLSPSPRGPHSPRLLLSPVTPLLFDPFTRSPSDVDIVAEDKAIADKGFFLHPVSPGESQPRLLPLFPLTSPR